MTSDSSQLVKGQQVVLTIASLTPTGAGITKQFGKPIFVERVGKGDVIEAELFDVRKDFARAKLTRVVQASKDRTQPPCALFKVCGGCQWQHLTYEGQLEAKTDLVKQSIEHIGALDPQIVLPVIGARSPLYYRNKVQFPVRHPKDSRRILAGYFKQDSHELINIKHCPVQPEPLDRMLEAVKEIGQKHGLTAYDEKTGQGLLRHITARYSTAHKDVLVTLVLNLQDQSELKGEKHGPMFQAITEQLLGEVPEIKGVCANLNSRAGNKIYGEETVLLGGESTIEEVLKSHRSDFPPQLQEGIRFRLSSTSFFQVNTEQAVVLLEVLFAEVRQAAQALGRKPVIIDAFAGVGTMSLWLAPLAQKIIAVEEHKAAVVDGQSNARLNGVTNVEFVQGDVEHVLPRLHQEGVTPDIVVLDPPRKGVSTESLAAIQALAAPLVLYVSCNPATLARDLRILSVCPGQAPDQAVIGYKTKKIQPVDLFPQTFHIESVARLERFSANGSVRDLEEA